MNWQLAILGAMATQPQGELRLAGCPLSERQKGHPRRQAPRGPEWRELMALAGYRQATGRGTVAIARSFVAQ